jgi:hypothetical protein
MDAKESAPLQMAELLKSHIPFTVFAPDRYDLKPFVFVLNISTLTGSTSLKLSDHHRLRHASNNEIALVKDMLTSSVGRGNSESIWEDHKPKSGKYVKLPKKEWQYFVIELKGDEDPEILEQALAISPRDLDIGLIVRRATLNGVALTTCSYHPARLFQSIEALKHGRAVAEPVTKIQAQQMGAVYARLQSHDHNIVDLRRVVSLVLEMKDLPLFSALQFLGYFAVLESLLTHPPKPTDPYESITRQIKKKLALLDKRWQPALDYSSFANVPYEKVWSSMYAYRSALAHGGIPDFKKELAVLGNERNAHALLRQTVKRVISQTLQEPDLIADLQNC